MTLENETLEALRKETTIKIKKACGIHETQKVLNCISAKKNDKYLILEYKRKDGKTFSKGAASRLSINGNYANAYSDKIEIKVKLKNDI